jgi:hypothetical protein
VAKRQFQTKKTLRGQQEYRKWEDYAVGDYIIGTYVGIHICQYKKENYKFKILDAQFEDADLAASLIGKTLVLNSAGFLTKPMSEVQEGETVKVEYNGKTTLQKGTYAGKDAHTGSVEIVELDEETAGESDGL